MEKVALVDDGKDIINQRDTKFRVRILDFGIIQSFLHNFPNLPHFFFFQKLFHRVIVVLNINSFFK